MAGVVVVVAAAVFSATPIGAQAVDSPTAVPKAKGPFDHDHAAWSTFLKEYNRDASVDYQGIKSGGLEKLGTYLRSLESVERAEFGGWSREQQLAFWLNAYNAYTIRLILDNYPVASIRSIGWLPSAAFRTKFIPIHVTQDGAMSLDDVEHGVVRPTFKDARVHFALVCAAKSCPPLRGEAYRAADVQAQLDDQGRAFLRDAAKNRYEAAAKTLYLSSIFDWFGEDFVMAAGSVRKFVARYLEESVGAAVSGAGEELKTEFLEYDWSLNGK